MMNLNWLLNLAHTITLKQGTTNERIEHNLQRLDHEDKKVKQKGMFTEFQMPLHYPRYSKTDYEKMEEWKLDLLLKEYGLDCNSSLEEKRKFAMGAFLWPDQFDASR